MGSRGRQLRRFLRPPTRLMPALPFDALHALALAARALFNASCVGGRPAPVTLRTWQWMEAPARVGDLVVEVSTWHRPTFVVGSVGLFECNEVRVVCSHEARDANHPGGCGCGPDERYAEHYTWLITGVKGRDPVWRHRWHNARFFRIPKTDADIKEIQSWDTGDDGFTRETGKAALADSGFELRR